MNVPFNTASLQKCSKTEDEGGWCLAAAAPFFHCDPPGQLASSRQGSYVEDK